MRKKNKTSESTTSKTSNIIFADLCFENDLKGFFRAVNHHYNEKRDKN